MKNKNVAALLAFVAGYFGIHRFYLGQVGLGIFYCLLSITGLSVILGILDGIIFLTMDEEVFDAKYNSRRRYQRPDYRRSRRDTDFQRPRQNRPQYRKESRPPVQPRRRVQPKPRPTRRSRPSIKHNPFKQSGIRKYKEFDFDAAIDDFKQALKINENDVTVHFNIACAYSQLEQVEKAYEHISKAVSLGFNDYNKIDTHDALAYMRIQPQWDEFKANGYSLRKQLSAPKENLLDNDILLEQLKKLNELKEKGLITEIEFLEQKEKLMR